jgi:hypothetical protein
MAGPPADNGGLHKLHRAPALKKGLAQKTVARPNLQQTLCIVMRSALPEEIEKMFHGDDDCFYYYK